MKPERIKGQSRRFEWRLFTFVLLTALTGFASVSGATYSIPADRSIDWSKAGVKGGIPVRTTIYTTLSPSGGNDATAINSAISSCPSGQVVKLGAGNFNISGPITLKSGVTLRGSGPASTKIYSTYNSTGIQGNIRVNGSLSWSGSPFPCPSSGQYTTISGSPAKDSATITVASASGLAVGDVISISQLNDTSLVKLNVQYGGCSYCGVCGGNRRQQQLTEITAINGTTLTIDPPLAMGYNASFAPWAAKTGNLIVNAGVEDLYLELQANTSQYAAFEMSYSKGCWLKNVETKNTLQRAVFGLGMFRNTVRDSYFHDSIGPGGTGSDNDNGSDHGYGVSLQNMSSYLLIENNRFEKMHLAIAMDGGPGAGNVIAYNYSVNQKYKDNSVLQPDIAVHSSFPHMNLFEGNYIYRIVNDTIHDGNGYNTYFRNFIRREKDLSTFRGTTINQMLQCFDNEAGSYYSTIVGNVLGFSGMSGQYEWYNQTCSYGSGDTGVYKNGYSGAVSCSSSGNDSMVYTSMLRHANYDYITKGVKWNGTDDHALPPSLYLSGKPSWMSSWPAIGPDVTPMYPAAPSGPGMPWGTPGPYLLPPTLLPAH